MVVVNVRWRAITPLTLGGDIGTWKDLLELDRRRPATEPRTPDGVDVVRSPLVVGK